MTRELPLFALQTSVTGFYRQVLTNTALCGRDPEAGLHTGPRQGAFIIVYASPTCLSQDKEA